MFRHYVHTISLNLWFYFRSCKWKFNAFRFVATLSAHLCHTVIAEWNCCVCAWEKKLGVEIKTHTDSCQVSSISNLSYLQLFKQLRRRSLKRSDRHDITKSLVCIDSLKVFAFIASVWPSPPTTVKRLSQHADYWHTYINSAHCAMLWCCTSISASDIFASWQQASESLCLFRQVLNLGPACLKRQRLLWCESSRASNLSDL